jgi:3-dehydroquinate synthase
MKTATIKVDLGGRGYPIHIGEDILGLLPDILARCGARGVIGLMTDTNVDPLYGDAVMAAIEEAGFRCVRHVQPAGEENKRLDIIEGICGRFLEAGLDRSSLIVALGGGVVGDMAGFTAAVFMRGIPFIQIPTTIVAQVDSSVGGKTGVNHPLGKNTIGAFHQPAAVLCDMALLKSLPDRELRAGLAEVIKHGVIASAELFVYLEQNAGALLAKDLTALRQPVLRSCEIKAAVVAQDEREQGLRAILNYGHTFGHAMEAASGYSRFLHGEAVALGMCAAGAMARDLGMVEESFEVRQRACIAAYELPVVWPAMPVDAVIQAMQKDKKARAGTLKFILAEAMGRVTQRTDISEAAVRRALDAVRTGPEG